MSSESASSFDHYLWPVGMGLVAAIVVAVNIGFIVVSQNVAPEVEPSYTHATER
jgi:hypothetical protein